MKGILAEKSEGIKLLSLLLLAIMGALLFTSLGMVLATSAYSLSFEEISALIAEGNAQGGSAVIKMVQGFATLGAFLFPALAGAYLFSHTPENFLQINHFPRPGWLIVILIAVLSYSSGIISDLLYQFSSSINWPESLQWVEEYLEESQEMMMEQYQRILQMNSFRDFIQVLMVMALLPAVAEEALFRGAVQPLMVRKVGVHGGVVLTALAFALLHQQFLAFLSIFALGLLLGYVKEWSQSLWVPTLMHFLNNGLIVVMVYYFEVDYNATAGGEALQEPAMIAVLLGIFLVSLLLLHRVLKQKKG